MVQKVICVTSLLCLVGCATPGFDVSVNPGVGVEAKACVPGNSEGYREFIVKTGKFGKIIDVMLHPFYCPE